MMIDTENLKGLMDKCFGFSCIIYDDLRADGLDSYFVDVFLMVTLLLLKLYYLIRLEKKDKVMMSRQQMMILVETLMTLMLVLTLFNVRRLERWSF